jgi:hypothetical protein
MDPPPSVAAAVPTPVLPQVKAKEDSALALAGSKVTVLPCRARGMPMDHNAKTAYFVVPEDVKHGAELVCSYDHCRNAGIKFRYCVFCSLPVAKRNFFKKHKHEGKIPPERLGLGIPKEEEMAYEGARPEETPKKQVTRSWNTIELAVKALASNSGLGKRGAPKNSYSSGEMAQMVEMRKRKWEKLLDTRPLSQSETELVLWIRKVLDVSDMSTPTPKRKPAQVHSFKPPPGFVEKKVEKKEEDKTEKKTEHKTEDKTEHKTEDKTEEKAEDKTEEKTEEKAEVKPATASEDAPMKQKEEEEDKASGAESSEGDEKSTASDDEEDAPAEDEKEDDNISDDASASSSGSSVDLRAHKRAKKE